MSPEYQPNAPSRLHRFFRRKDTDENGWTWSGTEWKQVSPESEGFSAEGLEALRSFENASDGQHEVISRGTSYSNMATRTRQQVAQSARACSSSLRRRDAEGLKFNLDQTVEQLGSRTKRRSSNRRHATLQQFDDGATLAFTSARGTTNRTTFAEARVLLSGVRWFYNNWILTRRPCLRRSLTRTSLTRYAMTSRSRCASRF